jgi:hypothetical protein
LDFNLKIFLKNQPVPVPLPLQWMKDSEVLIQLQKNRENVESPGSGERIIISCCRPKSDIIVVIFQMDRTETRFD